MLTLPRKRVHKTKIFFLFNIVWHLEVNSWLGSGRVTKSCPSSPNRRMKFSVPPQYLCSMWDNLPWFRGGDDLYIWLVLLNSSETYIFAIIILRKRINRQNLGEGSLLYIRFSPGNTGQIYRQTGVSWRSRYDEWRHCLGWYITSCNGGGATSTNNSSQHASHGEHGTDSKLFSWSKSQKYFNEWNECNFNGKRIEDKKINKFPLDLS